MSISIGFNQVVFGQECRGCETEEIPYHVEPLKCGGCGNPRDECTCCRRCRNQKDDCTCCQFCNRRQEDCCCCRACREAG